MSIEIPWETLRLRSINSQYFWKWTNANPMKFFSNQGITKKSNFFWRNQVWFSVNLLKLSFDPINILGWLESLLKVFMGLALVHFQIYWLLSMYHRSCITLGRMQGYSHIFVLSKYLPLSQDFFFQKNWKCHSIAFS